MADDYAFAGKRKNKNDKRSKMKKGVYKKGGKSRANSNLKDKQ